MSELTIETMNITPVIAAAWLGKNKRNRVLSQPRVSLYAREMRRGNWLDHHQGIAFYEDGTLADGQHRLAAIVESGKTIKMIVARGVSEDSGLMIDGHQQRKMHQAIKISGLADWIGKDDVATARMMLLIEAGNQSKNAKTHLETIEYCNFHREAIEFSMACFPSSKKFLTTAMTKACVAAAYYHEAKPRLMEFSDVIVSGMPSGPHDRAAILLREYLFQSGATAGGGTTRIDTAKRAMRAIKAFCDYEAIGKLYQPKEFIYTVPSSETSS